MRLTRILGKLALAALALGAGCAHEAAGPSGSGGGGARDASALARLDELRSRTATTCEQRQALRRDACALASELCSGADDRPSAAAAQRLCLEAGETCARARDDEARCTR